MKLLKLLLYIFTEFKALRKVPGDKGFSAKRNEEFSNFRINLLKRKLEDD